MIRKVREADRLLGECQDVGRVPKQLDVSEQMLLRWRLQYGGLKGAGDAYWHRELEREDGMLKRMSPTSGSRSTRSEEVAKGRLVSPSRKRLR